MTPRPREHVAHLEPYEWEAMAGDVAAAAGIAESDIVRFDTNTSAWPPVAWEKTVLDVPRLPANEYPHPSNEPLRSGLAHSLGVDPDRVVVTSGADEALFLVASVYLGPGRTAVVADPSFSMFRVVSEAVGSRVTRVPVDGAWDLPRDAVLKAVSDPSVGVAWLCSPNNPTGRLLSRDLVGEVLRVAPDVAVVVDEAYYEISGQTLAPLLLDSPNGILVRTFSKGYGLAGARVGYLVADRTIARAIESVRLPQNMTAFGIAAACRAFEDQDGLQQRVGEILAERERLAAALVSRDWTFVPSTANFVLGRPPADGGGSRDLAPGRRPDRPLISRACQAQRLAASHRPIPQEDDRLLSRLDLFGA